MISAVATRTLPGVRFTAEAPKLREVLPRMDIAAFVGFASTGPVNTPVPIEDIGRFRDVFGPDLPLAWDPPAGRQGYAQLGAAVEAFFLNGGRRCWIVRVNGAEVACETSPPLIVDGQTQWFAIPGLISSTGILAAVAARSPGSWSDALRVGATLRTEGLLLEDFGQVAESPPGPARFSAEIKSPASPPAEGDMIRLAFGDVEPSSPPDTHAPRPRWLAFLTVDGTENAATGDRVLVEGSCVWYRADEPAEEIADLYVLPVASMTPREPSVDEVDGLLTGGPLDAVRLTFDLLVWRDHNLRTRLSGLGFAERHPRFWGRLPSDDAIFKLIHGRPQKPAAGSLEAEVFDPRFPMAAPEATAGTWIPVGMSTHDDPERASGPLLDADPDTALKRDGLERFCSDLFLDPDLKNEHARNLLAKARDKHLLENPPYNEPLLGVHSLYPVDEVTLISVPDASHRAWTGREARVPDVLPAPVLAPVQPPDDRGVYDLSWTRVYLVEDPFREVAEYVLQESRSPDFADAKVVYRGPDFDAGLEQPADCSCRLFYRVRAQEDERISAWSNTESTIVPPAAFIDCEQPPPGPVAELIELAGSPPDDEVPAVAWSIGDFDPATVFKVERSFDPAFDTAEEVSPPEGETQFESTEIGGVDHLFVPAEETVGVITYYRVRVDEPLGPWSNTVAFSPTEALVVAHDDPSEFDAGPLLDLHRALLRFCAARADMMAVLNVPGHYGPELTLAHKGDLTPMTNDDVDVAAGVATTTVRPLTADEEHALSYGALFHPWVQQRFTGGENVPFIFSPPDGTMVGLMAEMAIRRGAWIAPANRSFKGVTATSPALTAADLTLLFSRQVNPVALDPQGFAALAAETLSPDDNLRQINVRRLLILLRRIVRRDGPTFVFEPNSDALRRLIHSQFDAILSDLFLRGALAGRTAEEAYQIVSDRSINTQASIDRGRLIIEIKIAPARPLVYVTVRLVQTGVDGLKLEEV